MNLTSIKIEFNFQKRKQVQIVSLPIWITSRFCLIIFTTFTIITTVAVLFSAPHILVDWVRFQKKGKLGAKLFWALSEKIREAFCFQTDEFSKRGNFEPQIYISDFLEFYIWSQKRNNSTMSLQNTPQKRASRPFETFLKTHPFRKGNVSLSINSGKLSFYQNRIIVWSLSLYKFFGGVSFGSKTKAAKKIILQKVSPYLTHIKNLLVGNNWFYTLYFWHPEL